MIEENAFLKTLFLTYLTLSYTCSILLCLQNFKRKNDIFFMQTARPFTNYNIAQRFRFPDISVQGKSSQLKKLQKKTFF